MIDSAQLVLYYPLHGSRKRQTKYNDDCFVFYPNIVIADVSHSDIRGDRNMKEHSIKMKWNLNNYKS